jgi:hypothetical protein
VTHDADLRMVYDQRGYTCGYVTECSCGFVGDLRDRQPDAIHDLAEHLGMTRPQPKDGTT